MKRLIHISALLLLTLGWAGVSQAAVTGPQRETWCNVAASSTPTCAFSGTLTPGTLLTATIGLRTSQAWSSLTDPTNGAWTCTTHSDGSSRAAVCYFQNNGSSSAETLTLTLGGSSATYWVLAEWPGAMTSGAADGTAATGTDNTGPFGPSSSYTSTTAGLILTSHGANATATCTAPPTGFTTFTSITGTHRFCASYRIGSATTTTGEFDITGVTGTTNVVWGFKEASSGAAAPRGLLLGVYP